MSLHGGLSHSFPRSPHGQWFRDLNLRGCLVSEDSCYIRIWRGFDHLGMYFHLMRFFSTHCISCMSGIGIISLGSLSLVSFRFFHPITLAYITSHVLRPP